MGTKITGVRQDFYNEDVGSGNSVSSFLASKIASAVQFINDKQIMRLNFGAQGPYSTIVSIPVYEHGMAEVIEFDSEIVNVWVRNKKTGSSGTTEVDIKKQSIGSSTWTSIFSFTPQFTSSSVDGARVDSAGKVVTAPGGVSRPVLDATNSILNAGDLLRFDLLQAMVGAEDISLIIHLKPRN